MGTKKTRIYRYNLVNTCFIYIHGVTPDLSPTKKGFSNILHARIRKELDTQGVDIRKIGYKEVLWSQITQKYKRDMAKLQFESGKGRRGYNVSILKNFIYPAVIDILFYIKNKGDDNPNVKFKIMQRLHDQVIKAKNEGYEHIVLIAHSLGTVVAYDYIFRFSKKYLFPENIKVDLLVTLGSPIALFAAGMGFPVSKKLKKPPAHIKKWINCWDPHDGVSTRCEPHFLKSFKKNFLKDYEVNTGLLPFEAHSGFMKKPAFVKQIVEEYLKII